MNEIFDVYEGLHLFNDAMYKATLYLEAVAKTGAFDQSRLAECRSSICQVRSATNVYLIGVIQQVERLNTVTKETTASN
jgi:hypothetical protein